jgi:beta-1,4-mannosyl-glycoprotein beta-1,4-N-acetylglucosaminyltransferase
MASLSRFVQLTKQRASPALWRNHGFNAMIVFVSLTLLGVSHTSMMHWKDNSKAQDISVKSSGKHTSTHLKAPSKEDLVPLQPSISIETGQPNKFQHYKFDCKHMKATPRNDRADKLVIDYINFNTEIDSLEIRIMSLKDHVDFFIVAESKQTHSGKSKRLYYLDHVQDRLEKQGLITTNKIIHVVIDSMNNSTEPWEIETYQRNTGLKMGLDKINFLGRKVGPGDALVICDLDEQPRPQVLEGLKMCEAYPQKMRVGLALFYYSFEYMLLKSIWTRAFIRVISPGEDALEISASNERRDNVGIVIPNAGWHCSYCFPNLTDILNKLASTPHQEYNRPPFTNRDRILFRVRYGVSLFDLSGFINLGRHTDIPTHLLANLERFSFMVDRRNAYSGFLDVRSEMNITVV